MSELYGMVFKVKRVVVLKVGGVGDIISITPVLPTPFPAMNYEVSMKIETANGYGKEYAELIGLTVDEVIDTR